MISNELKEFKGKQVVITTVKKSKYLGVIDGIREKDGVFFLRYCDPLTKDGKVLKTSGVGTRKFNMSSVESVTLATGKCDKWGFQIG